MDHNAKHELITHDLPSRFQEPIAKEWDESCQPIKNRYCLQGHQSRHDGLQLRHILSSWLSMPPNKMDQICPSASPTLTHKKHQKNTHWQLVAGKRPFQTTRPAFSETVILLLWKLLKISAVFSSCNLLAEKKKKNHTYATPTIFSSVKSAMNVLGETICFYMSALARVPRFLEGTDRNVIFF